MKKSTKLVLGVIALVLVASIALLAGQSNLFQGRLQFLKITPQIDYSRLFLYKNVIVSAVTSSVTSPVSSVVVSRIGTSMVASVVTSYIASAVTSAVAVDMVTAAKIDRKKLQNLTGNILKSIGQEDYKKNPGKFTLQAKEDYRKNPDKFTLSNTEKKKIIDLYKLKNPSQFIFKK